MMTQPNTKKLLPELPPLIVEEHVKAALREDLGRAGDITTQATITKEDQATAHIIAREQGIVAGLQCAQKAFEIIDKTLKFESHCKDGDTLVKDTKIATIQGNARAILSAERVALNYMTHLSGIASSTALFVEAAKDTKASITCTRKTLPGLRIFQKYAVKIGGGSNHRFGLDDAIMIKDNHIATAGTITKALERARSFAGHLVKIEIEVDTLKQLEEVLNCPHKPDVILLDNMSPDTLKQAVKMNQNQYILEASGGITLETLPAIAKIGVDFISSGWLTNSAPSLDLGLDIHIAKV